MTSYVILVRKATSQAMLSDVASDVSTPRPPLWCGARDVACRHRDVGGDVALRHPKAHTKPWNVASDVACCLRDVGGDVALRRLRVQTKLWDIASDVACR